MITAQYLLLHIILLLIFVIMSNRISKCKDENYWGNCLPLILGFTLEEGLRWGRDIDWIGYYYRYQDFKISYGTEFEFLFNFFFKNCAIVGIPYVVVISICSFMWIYSLCYFCKPYKELVKYFLPICLLFFTVLASNTYRWYLALSFFLMALRNFIDGKTYVAIALLLCVYGTHVAAFIISIIGIFFVYFYKNSCLVKPIYVVIFSILLIFFFQLEYMQSSISIFQILDFGRFSGYINDSEHWFFTETREGERKSIIEYVLLMIPFYIVMWQTYLIQLKEKRNEVYIFYNLLTILILLRSVTSGIELLQRMATFYDFIFVLLISFVFYYRKRITYINRSLLCIVFMFVLYKGVLYIKPYPSEHLMKYVWNSELITPIEAIKYYQQK